MYKNKYHLE